jgi:hypothetical protein
MKSHSNTAAEIPEIRARKAWCLCDAECARRRIRHTAKAQRVP